MYFYNTVISLSLYIDSGTLVTTCIWYNLDPDLSGLQIGHSNQCVKLKYLCTALITTWMGADAALKGAV